MNTREELVEVMAKGFEPTAWNASLFEFPDLDMPPRQEAAKRRARAALAALRAAGYVPVPVEPTQEMRNEWPDSDWFFGRPDAMDEIWRDTLAASPLAKK